MKVAVIGLGPSAEPVASALRTGEPACDCLRADRDGALTSLVERGFAAYEGLVFVMATGIVVRVIAPMLRSKHVDPAVVVVDDAARWAISLLSGHEGGANRLAYLVGALTGAVPVVTTGSETTRRLIVGIGCRRETAACEIIQAVRAVLREIRRVPADVRHAVSVERKRGDRGLRAACEEMGIPLLFIDEDRVNSYRGPYRPSRAARRNLGVRAVAEPCALLGGRATRLVVAKKTFPRVTVAVAEEGIGPGALLTDGGHEWER